MFLEKTFTIAVFSRSFDEDGENCLTQEKLRQWDSLHNYVGNTAKI